jgi:hypothetical protein
MSPSALATAVVIPCLDRLHLQEVEEQISVLYTSLQEKKITRRPGLFSGVWNEFDYRIGACRVTEGSHIEHL